MGKICILTPDSGYDERWESEAAPLRALFGKGLSFRRWTEAADLTRFDLVLPLLAWGYSRHASRWYKALDGWEAQGVPFINPITLLRWNCDKAYLLDLAADSVPIVPTLEANGLTSTDLDDAREQFGCERLVVKPAISAGADATYLLNPGDAIPFDILERSMLIQPVMTRISSEGEYSLFYFDGSFSHAVLKIPAAGDFRVQAQFGGVDVAVSAPALAMKVATQALAAAPTMAVYARVDLVRAETGGFQVMELELIEPSLFFHHAPDQGKSLADAILKQLT